MQTHRSDHAFLARAVELARQGSERGDGGPFGALIVCQGRVISEGWNQVVCNNDPTAHAEISAIRAACHDLGRFHLADCVLYASSEPCPMCLAAAYWARITRIVFANSRAEAAAIGFCDDVLYLELAKPFNEREISMEHQPLPGALDPIRAWAADPERIRY